MKSDFKKKRSYRRYSLWQWIGSKFVNILLSAAIFFLAGLLVNMAFFPRLYESGTDIYVAAVSGNIRVSASMLGDILTERSFHEITEGLDGFDSVPVSRRIKIEIDLGEGMVRMKATATDPYSAFDAISRAINISRDYVEENEARNALRVVRYPEFAKHFSFLSMLMPALYAALAGAVLAFLMTLFSYRQYESQYIEERKQKEQEAASAYAAFTPDNIKSGSGSRPRGSQEELMKSLSERTRAGRYDSKNAGDSLRKIMSAKDPEDDSGKITIPAYHEEVDNLDEDDAVNFLHFSQEDGTDVSIDDEYDEDADEEDLAQLFADEPESAASGKKGGR